MCSHSSQLQRCEHTCTSGHVRQLSQARFKLPRTLRTDTVSAATEASKNPTHLHVGPSAQRTHAVFFSAHHVPDSSKQINCKTTHKNTPLLMADPVVRHLDEERQAFLSWKFWGTSNLANVRGDLEGSIKLQLRATEHTAHRKRSYRTESFKSENNRVSHCMMWTGRHCTAVGPKRLSKYAHTQQFKCKENRLTLTRNLAMLLRTATHTTFVRSVTT